MTIMNRMEFIEYWARFMKEHPREAGIQHTAFINAIMSHAKGYPFSPKEYLAMKGEPCSR